MLMMPRRNTAFDLFDEMFKEPFFNRMENKRTMMKTDIREKDGAYVMDIDLPGFAKEDINAELNNGYMTITASRNESKDAKDDAGNYIHRERTTGTCSRTFYVGEGLKEDDVTASFRDGILRLSVPKEEPKKLAEQKKLIPIQ